MTMIHEQVVLILDFGSSNVRAGLICVKSGEIFEKASRINQWIHPNDHWSEMDPVALWKHAQDVVEEVLKKSSGRYEILGIGFSFFGDSLILTDERLNPLYNMVMAFDRRASKEAEELNQILGEEKFREIVGGPSLSMLVCAKIRWFCRNHPEIFKKAKCFLNIQEYILGKLGLGLWTDYTLANRKTMYDIQKKEWSKELIKATGIQEEQIGNSVGDSDQVIGEISWFGRVKLPSRLKVVLGAHDSECGFLGLGAVPGSDLIGNVSGTYEMVGYFSKDRVLEPGKRMEKGCGLKKNQMVFSGSNISGAYISWFQNELGGNPKTFFEDMERKVFYDGKGSAFFLTSHDRETCGFDGFSNHTSKSEMYQAVIEGITFQMNSILNEMDLIRDVPSDRIAVGGGGCASDKWLQLKADVFQKKVYRVRNKEVSALGSAILTSVGIGYYQNFQDAVHHMIQIDQTFEPREKIAKCYQEKYQKYWEKIHLWNMRV